MNRFEFLSSIVLNNFFDVLEISLIELLADIDYISDNIELYVEFVYLYDMDIDNDRPCCPLLMNAACE
jgi:hypothetical protein